MVELYLHSLPKRPYDVVLNKLFTGTILLVTFTEIHEIMAQSEIYRKYI
jgi:hypothetical protein